VKEENGMVKAIWKGKILAESDHHLVVLFDGT
jgi:uncharacterized protein (DUF427 family)